ncbi:hypothetical protein BH11BAC7_BH11BAC7_29690 [soil metagenome]
MWRLIIPFILLRVIFFGQDRIIAPSKVASTDSISTTDSILHSWLGKQVVENNQPRFKSLWLFVSVQELDSIRESKSLLRSFTYATISQQYYYTTLTDKKFDKQPLAGILRSSEKLRLKDAWTSYWPVVNEDQPGNQLVQVFMDDSALVIAFHPDEKIPFSVYDLAGNSLTLPQAIQRERHIAVVFLSGKMKSADGKAGVYRRSFYIINEKMIRHWQHATPVMQDGILKDLNYLLLLEAWAKETPGHIAKSGKKGKNILRAWNASPQKMSIGQKVFACRRNAEAIDFTEKKARETIAAIRKLWPLQVKPMEKFPFKGIR